MGQHYTKLTVSTASYCKKCGKVTQHFVADRRLGACEECFAKLPSGPVKAQSKPDEQKGLLE